MKFKMKVPFESCANCLRLRGRPLRAVGAEPFSISKSFSGDAPRMEAANSLPIDVSIKLAEFDMSIEAPGDEYSEAYIEEELQPAGSDAADISSLES